MTRRRRYRDAVVLGVAAVAALLLSLPNCGPTTSIPNGLRGRVRTVETKSHGSFDIVGYSILMFDHVSVEDGRGAEILRIFSGTREDLFPEHIEIQDAPGGVSVHVKSSTPRRFVVSDEDLRSLRHFGPRVFVGGQVESVRWSWFDALDGAVVLGIAVLFLVVSRTVRSAAEPPWVVH